ncbi:uncharacterized protein LOC119332970 [Triticum dicoccoides]|uniref:uncharacterized protein LOC119332970 n=1 Tax=Triticum dicoccoides TaxID=85692 RepID=UPI001890C09A|nr:uncharacterized protein LOC119332970 [Triticum dicoccoides]
MLEEEQYLEEDASGELEIFGSGHAAGAAEPSHLALPSPSRQAAVSPPPSRTRCRRNRPISLRAVVAKQASRRLTSTLVSIAGGPAPVQQWRKRACRLELEAAVLCLPAGSTGGGWPWRTATLFKRRTLLSTSSSSGPTPSSTLRSHLVLCSSTAWISFSPSYSQLPPDLLRNVLLHALAAIKEKGQHILSMKMSMQSR